MRAGPKPKPTLVKKLAGNPGRRPLNQHEPQFEGGPVTVPGWLDSVARREFKRVLRISPERLITQADRGTLAAMCQLYSRAVQAELALRKDGLVIATTNGNLIQNPYVGIANKAWADYVRLTAEFGLTPSSRTRIQLGDEPEAEDPFAAFMARKGIRVTTVEGESE